MMRDRRRGGGFGAARRLQRGGTAGAGNEGAATSGRTADIGFAAAPGCITNTIFCALRSALLFKCQLQKNIPFYTYEIDAR